MTPDPQPDEDLGPRAGLLADIAGYLAVALVIFLMFAFSGALR